MGRSSLFAPRSHAPRSHGPRCERKDGQPAMTVITAIPPEARVERNYLNASYAARSWLLTTDHKRVALLYVLSITLFFVPAGAVATLLRVTLLTLEAPLTH